MSHLNSIKCPVCGESVYAPCTLSGGYSGDYWNPPEGPDVEWDADEFDFNCDCRASIDQNGRTHKVARVKKHSTPEIHYRYDLTPCVVWTQIEYHKDAEGKVIYDTINDLLVAYDADIEAQCEDADYTYDPPDPPEYD